MVLPINKIKSFFFLILFFYVGNGLNANTKKDLVWPEMVKSVNFCEDAYNLTFDSLLMIEEEIFKNYSGESLDGEKVYWFHIQIKNSVVKKQGYYIRIGAYLFFTRLELYQIDNKNNIVKAVGGHLVPHNKKAAIKSRYLPFSISDEKVTDIYIKASSKFVRNYDLAEIYIVPKNELDYQLRIKDLFLTFLGGIMLMIILLNSWLFVSSQDRLYLFYSLYLLVTLIYFLYVHGITGRYVFNYSPRVNLSLHFLLTLTQPLYFWFFYELLKHDKIPKWSGLVYKYVYFVSLLWAVIFITSFIDHQIAFFVNDLFAIMNILFVLTSIILLFRRVSVVTKIVMTGVFVWASIGVVEMFLVFIQNNREALLLYYIAIFIEMLMFTVAVNYMYNTDRKEKHKLLLAYSKLEYSKSEKELENRILIEQLEQKSREVMSKEFLIAQNQRVLDNVSKNLIEIRKKKLDHEQSIQRLVQTIQINRKSENWKEFELHFNEIHPGFYSELIDLCPNLGKTDLKLCAFIKLNFTTKQIAAITGKTPNAIDVSRSRLRNKLRLKNGSLASTILSIGRAQQPDV